MFIRLLILSLLLTTQALAQQRPPARVVTAPVEEHELRLTTHMVGVLRFIRVTELAAELEGLITTHNFDTGWTVKQGDLLAQLNTDFIAKDIEVSRSEISEVAAEVEKLARELSRLESLKRDNLASRSAYDEAFYSHKVLVTRRDTLERKLERMQLSLEKSSVRAPFDGIVLEKKKELGDWVDKGEALARIGSSEGVQVIVPVSEKLLPFQQNGAGFDITIPALDRQFSGRLSGVVPFAEVRSKSVYLKITLPYEAGMIENLSAEVEVPASEPRRLRLIPRAALVQAQGGDIIYVVQDGKAASLPVNIVTRSGDAIAVDNVDITAGMQVIVDGNDRLQPGQPVQVVEH